MDQIPPEAYTTTHDERNRKVLLMMTNRDQQRPRNGVAERIGTQNAATGVSDSPVTEQAGWNAPNNLASLASCMSVWKLFRAGVRVTAPVGKTASDCARIVAVETEQELGAMIPRLPSPSSLFPAMAGSELGMHTQ